MAQPEPDPFAALADLQRRQIIRMLQDGELSVGALADQLPISRPAVSRHLKLLKNSRLVQDRSSGNQRFYRLDQQGVEEVREFLESVWGEAMGRFKLLAENTANDGSKMRSGRDKAT